MKQQWEHLTNKIDAFTLRERGMMLFVISVGIIVLFNSLILEPQFAKQKILSDKIKQEQAQIAVSRVEIAQRAAGVLVDPDAEIKRNIVNAEQQLLKIDAGLQVLQKNLVQPEKMTTLLESILKRNQKLQLHSLRNLPVINLMDDIEGVINSTPSVVAVTGADASVKSKTVASETNIHGAIYKHEVEIVLQGNYLDMVSYMRELESLPEQIYWSKGKLKVIDYPNASLTLNLFTLSLEKKWLNL